MALVLSWPIGKETTVLLSTCLILLSMWCRLDYECPDFCSERGVCDSTTGTCTCDPDWTGDACHVPICPNNCSGNGTCDTSLDKCVCNQGYQGKEREGGKGSGYLVCIRHVCHTCHMYMYMCIHVNISHM